MTHSVILLSILLSQPPAINPPTPSTPPTPSPSTPTKTPSPSTPTAQPLDPRTRLADAQPGTIYSAVTNSCPGFTEDGADRADPLTFSWSVPTGFKPNSPRDLVIVLPGHGMDATWAHRALPNLAPGAIVVGLDPTRESIDGRTPGLDAGDQILIRDAVLEFTRCFPTAKIILVGHSQGAFLQVLVANRFPRLINGLVALNAGLPRVSALNVRAVPTLFVGADADPLIPIRATFQARDVITDQGGKAVALITTPAATHAADPAAAAAAVAWVRGVITDKPDDALTHARTLISSADPQFGLAARILRRFDTDPTDKAAWPAGLKSATDQHKQEARALLLSIEALGLRHAAALRKDLPTPQALDSAAFDADLPAPTWLGHLLTLRETFRSVESVEGFLTELQLEETLDRHEPHARAIAQVFEPADWNQAETSPAETFDILLKHLHDAYLTPWLPGNIEPDVKHWLTIADELRLSKAQRAAAPMIAQYAAAIRKGRDRYHALNRQWQAP